MNGGPCNRCTAYRHVQSMGGWCASLDAPATGNGCPWFRCVARRFDPLNKFVSHCLETGDRVPIGPCPTDCEYHLAGRGRTC
jgi:hypothetical protein